MTRFNGRLILIVFFFIYTYIYKLFFYDRILKNVKKHNQKIVMENAY